MFADIMSGPTAINVGGVSALGQALVYREDEGLAVPTNGGRNPPKG